MRKRVKQEEVPSMSGQETKRRSLRGDSSAQISIGDLKCIFCLEVDEEKNLCAAGTLHESNTGVDVSHNENFTERLREKALFVDDSRLFGLLSLGSVATNEFNYHKVCLLALNNRYRDAFNNQQRQSLTDVTESFRKEFHFRKIISFIQEQRRLGERLFEVTPLELMYLNLLDRDGIIISLMLVDSLNDCVMPFILQA